MNVIHRFWLGSSQSKNLFLSVVESVALRQVFLSKTIFPCHYDSTIAP